MRIGAKNGLCGGKTGFVTKVSPRSAPDVPSPPLVTTCPAVLFGWREGKCPRGESGGVQQAVLRCGSRLDHQFCLAVLGDELDQAAGWRPLLAAHPLGKQSATVQVRSDPGLSPQHS